MKFKTDLEIRLQYIESFSAIKIMESDDSILRKSISKEFLNRFFFCGRGLLGKKKSHSKYLGTFRTENTIEKVQTIFLILNPLQYSF